MGRFETCPYDTNIRLSFCCPCALRGGVAPHGHPRHLRRSGDSALLADSSLTWDSSCLCVAFVIAGKGRFETCPIHINLSVMSSKIALNVRFLGSCDAHVAFETISRHHCFLVAQYIWHDLACNSKPHGVTRRTSSSFAERGILK